MPPRAGSYSAIPKPDVPLVSGFPTIGVLGTRDHFFEYAKEYLHAIHDELQWFEHEGGHEAPKAPELNKEIAQALRKVVDR